MERVVFLCGLVGPHVVRYLIENMVIKMTRNNGRRTFCPVLQNGPIKIRKRSENLIQRQQTYAMSSQALNRIFIFVEIQTYLVVSVEDV